MWSTVVPKNWYIKLFYRLNIFRVVMNQKWVLFFLGHPVHRPVYVWNEKDDFLLLKTQRFIVDLIGTKSEKSIYKVLVYLK